MKEEDVFFLPFFIKEKIYVIDKEKIDFSLGIGVSPVPDEEIKNTAKPNLAYLVLHQEPTPLPTPQEELLQNILKAINILPNQVEKLPIDTFQQTHLQDRKFVFVLSSISLPKIFSQLEKNKTRTLTEGTQVIFSESLSTLIADKQEKLALWTELKKAFEIK